MSPAVFGVKPRLRPRHFYASDPEFGRAFAVFLRQYPQLWRIRRLDRFRPQDLRLAGREIHLQGRIAPSLVEHFLRTVGAEMNFTAFRVETGDPMMLLLPIAQRPKRLLLNSRLERDGHGAIDTLSRYEDSWIEALNLLSLTEEYVNELILAGTTGTARLHPVRPEEEFQLVLFFATLVFQNPDALAKRVARWADDNNIPFGPGKPLTGSALTRWIQQQGDSFLPGVGTHLAEMLEPLIPELQRSQLYVSPVTRRPPLDCFGSIPSLCLHAIRDFLKLIHNVTPSWPPNGEGDDADEILVREDQLEDPNALAETAYHLFLDGVVLAEEKLSDYEGWLDSEPGAALNEALDTWWAYTQIEIELGVPFTVKISEILPLVTPPWPDRPFGRIERKLEEWKRTCYRTGHFYPLALKDAQSVHVEVEIPHPELTTPELEAGGTDSPSFPATPSKPTFDRRHPVASARAWCGHLREKARHVPIALIARLPDGSSGELTAPIRFDYAFGNYWRPSERLLHFYSSRQLHEAEDRDFMAPYLNLFVPLRFMRSVFIGYAAAIVAYLLAAAFVSVSLIAAMAENSRPALLPEVVTVGALAVTLSLWLTSNLSQEPIVNEKLVVARHLLAGCVGLMLIVFFAFLIYLAAHGLDLRARRRASLRSQRRASRASACCANSGSPSNGYSRQFDEKGSYFSPYRLKQRSLLCGARSVRPSQRGLLDQLLRSFSRNRSVDRDLPAPAFAEPARGRDDRRPRLGGRDGAAPVAVRSEPERFVLAHVSPKLLPSTLEQLVRRMRSTRMQWKADLWLRQFCFLFSRQRRHSCLRCTLEVLMTFLTWCASEHPVALRTSGSLPAPRQGCQETSSPRPSPAAPPFG